MKVILKSEADKNDDQFDNTKHSKITNIAGHKVAFLQFFRCIFKNVLSYKLNCPSKLLVVSLFPETKMWE